MITFYYPGSNIEIQIGDEVLAERKFLAPLKGTVARILEVDKGMLSFFTVWIELDRVPFLRFSHPYFNLTVATPDGASHLANFFLIIRF